MECSSNSYVTITSDFLKWNTAFAVGGILWLSNFITPSHLTLTGFQVSCVFLTLLLLLLTIVVSILIFYSFTHYLNSKWKLHFEWLNCIKNYFVKSVEQLREEARIATQLGENS